MDSCIGLDYIVENPDYVSKLAAALDTNNVVVKKQVFELLSALCVYSPEGRERALDALNKFQELKGERYRLKVVVDELSQATSVDYQKALIAFINCVVISTPQLKDRIRLRNEFIGLKLLPVLNDIRRVSATIPAVRVQLDVFDEQRESDEAQIIQGPHGVDLNSHLDVFYAILRQIADTPQEIPFLSILQHLLRIDPKEAISDIIWDTAETLVHRATLLENQQDVTRLLRSPSVQGKLNCHCFCHGIRNGGDNNVGSGGRKPSLIASATSPPPPPLTAVSGTAAPPPPPPPPPPLFASGGPPPPPPPPPLAPTLGIGSNGGSSGTSTSDGIAGGPPIPPPLIAPNCPSPANEMFDSSNVALLPQQEIPTPKTKMKTINWNKIPNHKIVGKNNIWSLVARSHQHSPMTDLDWAEMEGLFCQQAPSAPPPTASPRLGRDSLDADRRRKESSEILLLDGKRSLNVNIFLKQFRSSNEDIIQLIREGCHDDIGAEKLRGLLKLLPEIDELEMLKAFHGDFSKLGNAEKFLLQLIQVPNYKLRIESMLLKEEFAANMGYLEPSINAMIVAGEDLMTNKQLQEVLYMVVVAGNFLNFGGYAGNAAGVKLSSLQKLTDIRANKPGMNLIHYVAMQAEKKRKDLLKFPDDLTTLEDATKISIEQLQNEINILDTRIKKVRKQIELPSTEKDIKDQMIDFLHIAEQEVSALQRDMDELENVRRSLADFFCEDPATFKLEDCFKIFHGFCAKFRQAVAENERRRIQEEQTHLRRKMREEQLAVKKRQLSNTASSDLDCHSTGDSVYEIRCSGRGDKVKKFHCGMTSEEETVMSSPALSRKRMGSFSGPPGDEPQESPDITPTGSLRRRRSRAPSEDDDSNLMDFLRAAGPDIGRERKSWGSLDRSWARRVQRGSVKKRPDLLSADFSGDRERPSSPSPLAENRPIVQEEIVETEKPKPWKQKIEAWLEGNEKEDKLNAASVADRRNRRLQNGANRRSLESDLESENRNSLDTLPEEKSKLPPADYKRVYPDWRPAIEKTDVVGAMEAIEGAQQQATLKDKSAWRKSNLNLPEDDQDLRKLRRLRSRGNLISSNGALKSIKEEEKRKGLISALSQAPADEKLTLYLKRPSVDENNSLKGQDCSKSSQLKMEEAPLPPAAPRRLQRQDEIISDKIEIDSDNIETPPVTRRKFAKIRDFSSSLEDDSKRLTSNRSIDEELKRLSPEGRSDKEIGERGSLLRNSQRLKDIALRDKEDGVLGDGQFDRFSSARRTRRYKKNADSDGTEDKESPQEAAESMPTEIMKITESDDKEARLRVWQNRLKYHGTPLQNETQRVAQEAITDINKVGSELKNIEHVLEPATTPKTPTSTVSRLITPSTRRVIPKKDDCVRKDRAISMIEPRQVTEALKLRAKKPIIELKTKGKQKSEHEYNDEGFEEAQSLASETPSQETSSAGNCDSLDGAAEIDGKLESHLSRADSSGSGDTNTSSSTNPPPSKFGKSERFSKPGLHLDRSSSMRLRKVGEEAKPLKRSESLRKTDSQSSVGSNKTLKRKSVERSNSRSSLRSSRSSLNSATSVNTVRNLTAKAPENKQNNQRLAGYTSAIKNLTSRLEAEENSKTLKRIPSRDGSGTFGHRRLSQTEVKRPLSQIQVKPAVPASRSSSSGSSIGPSARRPRIMASNSFKEFQKPTSVVVTKRTIPTGGDKLKGNKTVINIKYKENNENKEVPRNAPRTSGLGFMKPTAASSAKDLDVQPPKLRSTTKNFVFK